MKCQELEINNNQFLENNEQLKDVINNNKEKILELENVIYNIESKLTNSNNILFEKKEENDKLQIIINDLTNDLEEFKNINVINLNEINILSNNIEKS